MSEEEEAKVQPLKRKPTTEVMDDDELNLSQNS